MTKQELFERNEKIINEVLAKIKRTCPNSIDMVAIGGSFASGDFYEKSDLDLLIIRNDDEGTKISKCFIMDDIGYDIYTHSWEDLKRMSRYRNPYVTKLKQLDIIYTRNSEASEKYKSLQADLNDNMSNDLLLKHNVSNLFAYAQNNFSDSLSSNFPKESYKALGEYIKNVEAIVYLINGKYVEHGTKGIPIEILKMKDLPKGFAKSYEALMDCTNPREIANAIQENINSVEQYVIDHDIDIKTKDKINK